MFPPAFASGVAVSTLLPAPWDLGSLASTRGNLPKKTGFAIPSFDESKTVINCCASGFPSCVLVDTSGCNTSFTIATRSEAKTMVVPVAVLAVKRILVPVTAATMRVPVLAETVAALETVVDPAEQPMPSTEHEWNHHVSKQK